MKEALGAFVPVTRFVPFITALVTGVSKRLVKVALPPLQLVTIAFSGSPDTVTVMTLGVVSLSQPNPPVVVSWIRKKCVPAGNPVSWMVPG